MFAWHACGCGLLDYTACVYIRERGGLVCVADTVSAACDTCIACAGGVLARTSGACWHSAFAFELLSVHASTSGVGGSDGMAQAAGPGTGDPYVGGPGIKAIGLAASPPATQVLAILVQGAAGQVIVANAVWARAGAPASRSPFHFYFFNFFSFFSSNLS